MNTMDGRFQDVMQVCRNGHVITDLLYTLPERGLGHCDRCGAVTLHRCLTCGTELPGSVHVPGLVPLGKRQPPQYCPTCGAMFPWTERQGASPSLPARTLEQLLRRLPLAIRQLRERQGERRPLRVEDEADLEDLLRALLPLHFEEVRRHGRTPAYARGNRTDFLLAQEALAVTLKRASGDVRERQLASELTMDISYWQAQPACRTLFCLVYDPEALVAEPRRVETAWSKKHDELGVQLVIAT